MSSASKVSLETQGPEKIPLCANCLAGLITIACFAFCIIGYYCVMNFPFLVIAWTYPAQIASKHDYSHLSMRSVMGKIEISRFVDEVIRPFGTITFKNTDIDNTPWISFRLTAGPHWKQDWLPIFNTTTRDHPEFKKWFSKSQRKALSTLNIQYFDEITLVWMTRVFYPPISTLYHNNVAISTRVWKCNEQMKDAVKHIGKLNGILKSIPGIIIL